MFAKKLKLKKISILFAKPPCRIPIIIKTGLKKSQVDLEMRDKISEYDGPTEWLSCLVIIEKKNNMLRLCLDPWYYYNLV